ncbi:MAG: DUF2513 domain-containing protein [Anaerolineales bacterium]|nr:DUF2513 domain-containing protein [Anaerolineales bacterium]
MDLVRKLLLAIEASERPLDSTLIRIVGYTTNDINDHVRLLQEAGLVDGISSYSIEHRLKWIELRLTWTGHDFIDAARSEQVWMEAARMLRKQVGTSAFEVWKSVLSYVARERLGVEDAPAQQVAQQPRSAPATGFLRLTPSEQTSPIS